MAAALDGDGEAYRALLVEVADRVRRFARRRLARKGYSLDDVEDIVQEVLVALHTRRDTWDASRPIGPWIDAIIRYKTTDAERLLHRRRVSTDTLDQVAETVAAAPVGSHHLAEVGRYLEALSQRERGVVSALCLDGISVAGCAKKLGISEVAVRVAFHRGLARLARRAESGLVPEGRSR
ncbi:MAG: sigma-70 family RNA polymerase sigma factor [Pseudomonadota bacterium]